MLSGAFTCLLQLPPLAFGPALPPRAFEVPRALVCDIHDLGRIQEPVPTWPSPAPVGSVDPRLLKPAREAFLVNRPVDMLMLLTVAYAGRASWEETPWADRAWRATGAVTPVLLPPMAPPAGGSSRR